MKELIGLYIGFWLGDQIFNDGENKTEAILIVVLLIVAILGLAGLIILLEVL